MNERWLLDRELLDRFARHYQTGEPMPQSLVDKIERSGKFNQGYAHARIPLAAAIVDMDLHTRPDGVDDMAVFEREALARVGGMPREVVMRHRLPHFDHLFGNDMYSAGLLQLSLVGRDGGRRLAGIRRGGRGVGRRGERAACARTSCRTATRSIGPRRIGDSAAAIREIQALLDARGFTR